MGLPQSSSITRAKYEVRSLRSFTVEFGYDNGSTPLGCWASQMWAVL